MAAAPFHTDFGPCKRERLINQIRRVLSSMILGAMPVMLVAPCVGAEPLGQTKAGPIRLQLAGSSDRGKITEIKLGEKIKVVAKLRARQFLDATAAFGNADVCNTTHQPMHATRLQRPSTHGDRNASRLRRRRVTGFNRQL